MNQVNIVTELIRVTGVSEYSVYSGQQRYSFNKGVTSSMFAKGNTYSVNVKVGKNGGKYIDSVSNNLGILEADVNAMSDSAKGLANEHNPTLNPSLNKSTIVNTNPRRAKMGEPLTDYDLMIQQHISKSGVIQASVQACAPHSKDVDDLKTKSVDLAEHMLAWVNQTEIKETQTV